MKYFSVAKEYVAKFFALPSPVIFVAGGVAGYLVHMVVG